MVVALALLNSHFAKATKHKKLYTIIHSKHTPALIVSADAGWGSWFRTTRNQAEKRITLIIHLIATQAYRFGLMFIATKAIILSYRTK